jgi:extracellular factor (EF) 3-hydroxypalmitic acid methyl ester biosynthesis protein
MDAASAEKQYPEDLLGLGSILDNISDSALERDDNTLKYALRDLYRVRSALRDEHSVLSAQSLVRKHRAFPLLLEDPYTHHAFTKPRGFAGDASLIDLFYGHRSGSEAETGTGRFVFETLMRFPSCEAVRFRRGYYGAFLDRMASGPSSKADVLAIACGHLREALFSRAVTDGAVTLTGIDSDPLAVAEAQRSLFSPNVTVRNASVIDFVRRRAWGETYDGIYAAGLFDYLDVRIGRKVVETGFAALRPGGTLSIANYLPTIVEQGYMDLVMDWRLIYRTSADMLALATNLPQDRADMMVWTDPLDAVVYLTVTKRG